MNPSGHADLGPELRQLAQAILDRIDPALRSAAARAGEGPGKCQQVWCPVCALAALVTGDEHPLLTMVAEHSAALLAMVRAMVADPADADRPPEPPTPAPPDGDAPPAGRYQSIPITVHE